jgi:2-iminobutanoate/2-iminopropanoate deaminase
MGDVDPPAIAAGGLLYLSGVTDPEPAADVAAQTRHVLQRLDGVLREAGGSLLDVVSAMVYLRSAAGFQAMNAAYGAFWPDDPPTRTTVVADLLEPSALVQISAVAVAAGGDRIVVRPRDWIASPSPYSYAIRSGDLVFLSGLVSRNGRDNSVVAGDVSTQTRVVLDNAGELLQAAGLGFEHVVSARVFLPDPRMFDRMNDAYAKYFNAVPPARATIAAALAGSQYNVEITLVASAEPRARIEPATPLYRHLPLSAAVRAGDRLFLSGALATAGPAFESGAGTKAGESTRQTRETLRNIERVLSAAGSSPADVVDATVFLAGAADHLAVDAELDEFFQARRPACTTLRAPLIAPDALIEVATVAAAH